MNEMGCLNKFSISTKDFQSLLNFKNKSKFISFFLICLSFENICNYKWTNLKLGVIVNNCRCRNKKQ